jgi:asparagine synthase (glutamine-hydrolysing)
MFALALWDEGRRRLFLARDRLGIKPLYYWTDGRRLAFASELKALLAWPELPADIDPVALDQYLAFEYVPSPRTIFKDICKLPAGYWLSFDDAGVRLQQYWDPAPHAPPASAEDCVAMLRELLADAVKMQMVSDVPLGAFLSGGIDSSTVVACMRRATAGPVRTFSVGFDDNSYDELPYARMVARQFGTEHHEEVLQPEIGTLVTELVGQLDEPFADFSIFPTHLVSRMARREVKVALSGDGGDELFGGYDTYRAQHADRYYRRLPAAIRQTVLPALFAQVRPRPAKKGLVNKVKRFVQGGAQPADLQHARWMIFLDAEDRDQLYTPELWAELHVANGSSRAEAELRKHFQRAAHLDPLAQQQYVDMKTYLVDDILTKVDRMSMSTSLEVRVPLLDHRIVEFALGLPPHLKLQRGQTKVILRAAMKDLLPEAILDKPKEGFSIPLKQWLRGPLQPLMHDLLSAASVRQRGYFSPPVVAGWIDEHLSGRANHSHRLWALMVLELWQRQLSGRQLAPDRLLLDARP